MPDRISQVSPYQERQPGGSSWDMDMELPFLEKSLHLPSDLSLSHKMACSKSNLQLNCQITHGSFFLLHVLTCLKSIAS